MTTANEEFGDLMPHRLVVSGAGSTTYDDDGRPINDPAGSREYMCLLDDTATTVRTQSGIEITVTLTAYVAPVPLNSGGQDPVDIEDNEKIVITEPDSYGEKEIISVERHFDSDMGVGALHNIVLRLQ
jgi:hypothetical protein